MNEELMDGYIYYRSNESRTYTLHAVHECTLSYSWMFRKTMALTSISLVESSHKLIFGLPTVNI
jgi:uncharacterized HAD superfamily protein